MNDILIGVAMAIAGHLIHLVKKVVEKRSSGSRVGLIDYVSERPYRTVLGMAGSAVAMGFMIEANTVSAMGALAVGYMADSGLGMLGGKKS